ncbi:MAG: hypothetical protein HY717_21935 [Planctomycetes bacterium]|nr:hypothetical protein [Planctomycetota bacterium]
MRKIVTFHHPIYSSAVANPLSRGQLEPLFNQYGVDLAFQAHTHFYERTYPLRGGAVTEAGEEPDYLDPQGTIYLVIGGGGGTLLTATPKAYSARYKSTYHWVEVEVDGNRLALTAIDSQGAILDKMTITKTPPPGPQFRRGDANADGALDVSDAVFALLYLFAGRQAPACEKSLDCDQSGKLEVADPIVLLRHLFLNGPPPPEPFAACGSDPAAAELACKAFPPCS